MDEFNQIKTPEELLKYMDNITYGFIGKNGKRYTNMFSKEWEDWYKECYVQSGEEVINTKIGTCWDQVELERLWFIKKDYNFKTIFMCFEANRDISLPTHTFLIFEKNNKYYWFEHSYENYRGIHEFNSYIEAIEYVRDKQFEYAKNNYKGVKNDDKSCLLCYEYSKPISNLGVDEYLKFVTSKNKLNEFTNYIK